MTKKYLTFDDRVTIQFLLNEHKNSREISDRISKDKSTVSREIKRHSYLKLIPSQTLIEGKEFHHCMLLKKFPCVCNACPKYLKCRCHKVLYSAKFADKTYHTTLKYARKHSIILLTVES